MKKNRDRLPTCTTFRPSPSSFFAAGDHANEKAAIGGMENDQGACSILSNAFGRSTAEILGFPVNEGSVTPWPRLK